MTIDARTIRRLTPTSPAAVNNNGRWVLAGLAILAVVSTITAVGANLNSTPPADAQAGQAGAAAPAAQVASVLTQADRLRGDEAAFIDFQEAAKSQLSAILKDPDSARYRNVFAVAPPAAHGKVSFCGTVNAKNSYGGYGGYTRFFIAPRVGAWLSNSRGIRFTQVWRDFCRDDYVIGKANAFN